MAKRVARKKYSVVIWRTERNGDGAEQRWTGDILEEGQAVAAYEYINEMFMVEATEKGLPPPTYRVVDFNYASKVKSRVTLLEEVSVQEEVSGILPKIIQDYGNAAVAIFQRVH